MQRSAKSGRMALSMLLTAVCLLTGASAQAENPRLALPRSHLSQAEPAPVFLAGYVGLGGALEADQGQVCYGGQIIFQPASAASFLNQLYQWNCSLVLQIDYLRQSPPSRMLSGDMIIRNYLSDRRVPETDSAMFFGVGLGATHVRLPLGGVTSYFSGVLEAGQEWDIRDGVLLTTRLQFRYYNYGGYDYSAFSITGGLGMPLPW